MPLRLLRGAYADAADRYQTTADEAEAKLQREREAWAAQRAEFLAEIVELKARSTE